MLEVPLYFSGQEWTESRETQAIFTTRYFQTFWFSPNLMQLPIFSLNWCFKIRCEFYLILLYFFSLTSSNILSCLFSRNVFSSFYRNVAPSWEVRFLSLSFTYIDIELFHEKESSFNTLLHSLQLFIELFLLILLMYVWMYSSGYVRKYFFQFF